MSRADALITAVLDEKATVSTNDHSTRSSLKSLRGASKTRKPSDLQLWHRFQAPKVRPRKEHEDLQAQDVHGMIKFRVLTRAHQKELFPK